MILGYTSSIEKDINSICIQKELINKYCKENQLSVDRQFTDSEGIHYRLFSERERAERLGLPPDRFLFTFPELEEMFITVMDNKVLNEEIVILVDTKARLFGQSEIQRETFEKIIEEYNIQIIEVGLNVGRKETGLCIYHCTNQSSKRPLIILKQLDHIYQYVLKNELSVTGIFVDYSVSHREKLEYLKELLKQKKFTGVIVASTYLLSRKIGQFVSMVELAGIFHSITEGIFYIKPMEEYVDESLNVVALCSTNSIAFGERMEYYCSKYTKWLLYEDAISSEYFSKAPKKNVKMVIIESYSDIDKDVNRFIKKISSIGNTTMVGNTKERKVLIYDRKSSILC